MHEFGFILMGASAALIFMLTGAVIWMLVERARHHRAQARVIAEFGRNIAADRAFIVACLAEQQQKTPAVNSRAQAPRWSN